MTFATTTGDKFINIFVSMKLMQVKPQLLLSNQLIRLILI